MDINEPLHGQIHLWMIAAIIIIGYIAVIGNKLLVAKNKVQVNRRVTNVILILILMIYAVMFAYLTFLYREPMEDVHVKLEPFWSYKEAFIGVKVVRLGMARSIVLNIAITVPLGYLLPAVYRNVSHRCLWTILTVVLLSVITEFVQIISKMGLAETDDVINNTFGAVIGLLGYILANRIICSRGE